MHSALASVSSNYIGFVIDYNCKGHRLNYNK